MHGQANWRHWLLQTEERLRAWGTTVEAWSGRRWRALHADARLRQAWTRFDALAARHASVRNLGAAVLGVWLFNGVLYLSCGLRGCPDPAQLVAYQPGGASELLDREGRKFGDLSPVRREVVKLAALPEHVGQAFIAVEDKRFFQHKGVDWRRVGGAALANLKAGGVAQGSSTITMQLSRNIFSDRLRAADKSLRRKIMEVRVARAIERRFSKGEILELYLNHIYFGRGAYGVQAAARQYFDKPAARLDLDEAALLAALPKAPGNYDPRNHPERAKERRDLVLGLMAEQSLITREQSERAAQRRLGVTREGDRFGAPRLGAYFAALVREQVERELGERIYREKLRVYTTLDREAQRAVEQELERQLRAVESGRYGGLRAPRHSQYDDWTAGGPQYLQGAAVFMESATGDVIAMAGGRNFEHSAFNRATRARRQTGSAFKPFVYAAALQEGYVPSQPILDTPFKLVADDGAAWEPRNFDNEFYGAVSMRDALVHSRNIPSVRLAAAVGEDKVAEFAREAGLQGEVKDHPMIALGITEATPLELARAYGSFAGMGVRAEPRFVQRVVDADGDVVWQTEPRREAAIKPAVAFVVTDMLADAVDVGTGKRVREVGYEGPAAGKTGTTSDGADTWFAGYTPDLVGVVWLGFDQRRPLPAEASGGSVAAPAWGRMIQGIYRTRPQPEVWVLPETVVPRDVDPASGLVLEEGCRPKEGQPRKELFLTDEEPDTICPAGTPGRRNFLRRIWDAITGLFKGDDPPAPAAPDPSLGVVRVVQRGGRDDSERSERRVRDSERDEPDSDRPKKRGKAKGKEKRGKG